MNKSEGEVEDEDDLKSEDKGESENKDGSESEGENINTPRPAVNTPRPAVSNTRRVGRGSSVAPKTNAILRQLRKMSLGFGTFVQEATGKDNYRKQLNRTPELTRSLYICAQIVDNSEKAAYAEYRAELKSISRYDHFQTWKAEDVDHLQSKAEDVMEEMNTRAPQLMSLFQVITRPADPRSNRDKATDHGRWITIMAILLYTYMPRTCTRWPTM